MATKKETIEVLDSTGVVKVEVPKKPTVEQKVIDLSNSGFNINQIASMLALHSHVVKEILENN